NYPNPFNPSTTIRFSLPGDGALVAVTLEVLDVLGRPVATLIRGHVAPGNHEELFNADGLPSGVYIYRLSAQLPNGRGHFQKTRRMLLLK
ncbi:MAG: T9SS type A sorting domain-containing protein, partial [Bacteroidetes bacterium]|nr:T9SS type A sorting domain-containing protein [Bacteroidota bacterium]